jgi:flagellar motor component MotA
MSDSEVTDLIEELEEILNRTFTKEEKEPLKEYLKLYLDLMFKARYYKMISVYKNEALNLKEFIDTGVSFNI